MDLGSRGQQGTGSGIHDPDPQHCPGECHQRYFIVSNDYIKTVTVPAHTYTLI
jgi:hypothetical protein